MKARLQMSPWKVFVVVATLAVVVAVPALAGPGGEAKSEHWGVIDRNTIGSPVGALRDGPYSMTSTGTVSQPPFGKGSLGIEVANGTEKVAFGNEVDFFGDPVSGITAVGYQVFQTGEDQSYGGAANLPNITFEIDPNVSGVHYSSMVWVPGPLATPPNQWSPYIDATTTGYWYFTNGTVAAATGCTQAGSCTSLAAAQSGLASAGGSGATILSVAIAKGRDSQFQGAVDGLRLNDKVYDFESNGVKAKGAK
jgi:hypothetical protein